MANNIVQLKDYSDNNVYPIAGAATQGSITKAMLEEGIFEGPELSTPSSVAYVATDNIQDGAVTPDKIDWTTQTYNYTSTSDLHVDTGVTPVSVSISVQTNGETATIWGRIQTTATNASETQAYVQTPLRPAQRIEIAPCGICYGVDSAGKNNANMTAGSVIITTDGKVIFRSVNWYDATSDNKTSSLVFPTQVYLK